MTDKELVILAAHLDLVSCRWSVAALEEDGAALPLVQSQPQDLQEWATGDLDRRVSFLRHRIAGALQRGADRLWGRQMKARLFAIEFHVGDGTTDGEVVQSVADHFCTWMVRPPVTCVRTCPSSAVQLLATNSTEDHLPQITHGLQKLRPLTALNDLWELAPPRRDRE